MTIRTALPLTIALALASCGQGKDASFSLSADDSGTTVSKDGKTVAATDGRVKIDAPGFKLDVAVPHDVIQGGDFDIDGVKLYPGTKVGTVNVNAPHDGDPHVRLGFTSPAAPGAVRDYLVNAFKAKGREVHADGMTLTGRTKDDKPFTITLADADGGATRGQIDLTGHGGADWKSDD